MCEAYDVQWFLKRVPGGVITIKKFYFDDQLIDTIYYYSEDELERERERNNYK